MRTLILTFVWLFCTQLSLQQECSATQLCENGCCSQWGSCGYGPDFCGQGCLSTCDRKSDCNPGWDSDQWSKFDKCPLNVCCSEHGFCGYTDEFCGDDDAVERPSCSIGDTPVRRVIGYYEAWSMTERSCYGMLPEDIPFGYYTHINFAFVTIDPSTFKITPGTYSTKSLLSRIGALKLFQPDLKIWVAVGGWAFNDPGPTETTFSDIAASTAAQDAFISSLIQMINQFGLDGVDLDWEYPVAEDRSGRGEDFENFVTFMDRLRKKLDNEGMREIGISLTLPSSFWYLQHFDIKNLERSLDWFNIMSYDIHGSWDIDNKFTGPYVNSHTNLTEIQLALDLLWRNDINPDKVVLGMAFYSRSFTLVDSGCTEPGCLVSSGGNAGKCSKTTGVLLHPEIQDIIDERKLTPTLYRDAAYKAVSFGDQWVSFDDAVTWRLKANLARSQCISGVMVWAMSQDDAAGTNIKALTSAVGRKQMDYPDFVERPPKPQPVQMEPAKMCTWAACGQECPSGFKLMTRDGKGKEVFGDHISCSGGGQVKLCCPADQPLPTCSWRGHRNTGWCKPGCNSDEVEIGSLRLGCSSGYQSACCTDTASTSAWASCRWHSDGCSAGKDAPCSDEFPHFVYSAAWGQGGMPPCGILDAKQSYCCRKPPPADFSKCSWITDREDRAGKYCDACRDDQIRLGGRWTDKCLTPSEAFCCDRPKLEPLDPRDGEDEDPFGNQQAEEFRLLIAKYMDNPTCPATILEPDLHDRFSKRSLPLEAREFDILRGRAVDCTENDWILLLQFATVMLRSNSESLDPFRDVWDDDFADPLDEQFTSSSLTSFFGLFPDFDPSAWLEYILYNPQAAGSGMRRARGVATSVCEVPPRMGHARRDALERRDQNTTSSVIPRAIWAFGGGTNNVPSLTTIWDGIAVGDLTLHYARWEWAQGLASNAAPGPMLELAYWIGTVPGVDPNDDHFDQYRDTSPRDGRSDRWVVFHLHIDPAGMWLENFNDGRTYLGVNALSVFHGQTTFYPRDSWRVSNRDHNSREGGQGLNERDGFNCPRDLGAQWYVGRPVNIPADSSEEDRRWYRALERWGDSLRVNGYAQMPGLGVILPQPGQLPNGEIDTNNLGPLIQGQGQSPALGGGDAYGTNWIVQGNLVDTFVPSPPPPWQS